MIKLVVIALILIIICEMEINCEEVENLNLNFTKIVGGDVINISDAPYQASLAYDGNFICGASIISTQYLLTAAHCVHRMSKNLFTIRVGSSFSDRDGEVLKVIQVIPHPRYNQKSLNFDFAILKVKENIQLEPNVKEVIALPSANDVIENNSETFVTGFGTTLDNSVRNENALRGVIVPTVAKNVCRRAYPFVISKQMVCAGLAVGGKDSCSGDSGGPMRRRKDGVLIGVVSFGKGCALPKLYGVYAKVSSVRKWIKNHTNI